MRTTRVTMLYQHFHTAHPQARTQHNPAVCSFSQRRGENRQLVRRRFKVQLDPSVREAPIADLARVVSSESSVDGSGITQSEPHIHAGEVRLVHTLRAAQAR
eukprot:scaffold33434_cov71-Phaeocystis_antarctica.AAC.5